MVTSITAVGREQETFVAALAELGKALHREGNIYIARKIIFWKLSGGKKIQTGETVWPEAQKCVVQQREIQWVSWLGMAENVTGNKKIK